ncbi:TPA: sigma-70 family RNA polymerase sigma factor [Candidatus Poribacteria bacterium]|nr:sigma-70 family RNA polymerase sigma factor [Candidatus Poribacteria bacterium]
MICAISFLINAPFCLATETDEPEQITPAQNDVPPGALVGERPYEMVWANRTEERPPLVDFEDLSGWTVATYAGANATFARSREQQMWGQYVGKLTYTGKSADSKILLQPQKPIPIENSFDCVNLWCYGNNWAWQPDQSTPQVNLAVHLQDSDGRGFRIPLTHVRWREWWLVHKRIDKAMLDEIKFPCAFTGLEILGGANSEKRTLYFDSFAFYTEELKPLTFEPRPARNIKPFPGQSHGLNGTGEGALPFPTREETILPENFECEFTNTVESEREGEFTFRYSGEDGICYVYKPQKGNLSEITAFVNGKQVAKPLMDGGVRFADDYGIGKLESAQLHDDTVTAIFACREGDETARVEYHLSIKQKSLILDVLCRGGSATELSLGHIGEVANPRLITIPYLTYGSSNPRVLMMSADKRPLFASVWVDWYRSNGSELYSEEWEKEDSAKINGGVKYLPKTDGTRNDLFERIFLTISPIFEETLPTIANPPSPWGKEAGNYLWQESWGPSDYEKEHERSKMLRSYGIDKLIQCNHEIAWRDGGESFTLRTKAAPKKGGDEALQRYVAAQKSLGWRSGLYTNYCDYAPVNEHWDEDGVQRTPENDWRHAWARCYALKPSRAVEWDAKLAPIIKQKYDSNSAYTDVHTAVAPWRYCDYDARVPGAGTFAATFYAYGEILLNDQKVYDGPIFSEGTYQWLYAGLASGNYGLAYTNVDLSENPLNVAFDLMKIHPLECDIGMPWTAGFFKKEGWNAPERIESSIDRFIVATLAYGHIGWLVEESHGIRLTCRSYYLIQQVAKRYAMQRPTKIEYANTDGKWLTVSQALATNAIEKSRLHVVYENGLELFVNYPTGPTADNWRIPKNPELERIIGEAIEQLSPKQREVFTLYHYQGLRMREIAEKLGMTEGSVKVHHHRAMQKLRSILKDVTLPSVEYVILPPNGFFACDKDGFIATSMLVNGHRVDKVISPEYAYLDGRSNDAESEWLATSGAVAMKFSKEPKQLEIIDIEGNEQIGFRCDFSKPVCTAYDPEGNSLGIVALEVKNGKYWLTCLEGARQYIVTGK